MEVLMKPNISTTELASIKALLSECRIIEMNQAIKEKAIQNNQDFCLKLADSIILASAQTCSIPLLTADIEFRKNIIQNQYDSTIRIIFAPTKPGTPLTQAHFAGSFFAPNFHGVHKTCTRSRPSPAIAVGQGIACSR